MDILMYEKCIEKMEEAGIDVKEYNNYIINQTVNAIWSNIGDNVKAYTGAVNTVLTMKCMLCDELRGLDCSSRDFDALSDASLFVMMRSLYFTLEEICELFHTSSLVVSSRVSSLNKDLSGVDDAFIAAITSRVTGQILEGRGRQETETGIVQ